MYAAPNSTFKYLTLNQIDRIYEEDGTSSSFSLQRTVLTDGSLRRKLQLRLWPTVNCGPHIGRWGFCTCLKN